MDGLIVYKEYLNKISKSSKGIEFNEISSLNLDDISNRVLEISDLLRIDEIFIKAGLKLSFIGDKSFLEDKIEVENKYLKYFIGEENDEDLNQALSQYLSQFVGVQDIVANEIANVDKLFEKEDKIPDETVRKINLPKTEDSFCSLNMLLEQQKDVLSNLFSGLNDLEDTKLGETEEVKDSDNVDSSNSVDSVDSVDGAESEEIEIEVQDEPENSKGIIEQENKIEEVCESGVSDDIGGQTENLSASGKQIVKIKLEDIKKTEDIKAEEIENTRIFDSPVIIDDQEEAEEAEVTNEIESVDKSEEIDDFDKSRVLDESENEGEIYDLDESEDLEILTKDFENFTDSSDSSDSSDSLDTEDTENEAIEDNSGSLLQKELEDEDSDDIDFSDMQKFKKETEYFLKKSKSKRKSDINVDEIKRICQSSERLSKIEDMSKSDDDLLKFLVGLSLGVSEVPKVTKSIISKLRKGSKTVYSNMVVDDTEED